MCVDSANKRSKWMRRAGRHSDSIGPVAKVQEIGLDSPLPADTKIENIIIDSAWQKMGMASCLDDRAVSGASPNVKRW